jgi:peptide/nickel transport system ATP-binding protein
MIALALSCNPQLLLADEPTTALDATVQIQILILLREQQKQRDLSIMFVTHDIGAAVEIADRVAVMYAGRIVEEASMRRSCIARAILYPGAAGQPAERGAEKGDALHCIPGAPPDLARCRRAARLPSAVRTRARLRAEPADHRTGRAASRVSCHRWRELSSPLKTRHCTPEAESN